MDFLNEKQKKIFSEIKSLNSKILLNLPTGFGKTRLGIFIGSKFEKVLVLVPRKIIKEQWESQSPKTFQICMQKTFSNSLISGEIQRFDCVIWDECHLNEKMVCDILSKLKMKSLVLLTASPKKEMVITPDQTICYFLQKNFKFQRVNLPFVPKDRFFYFEGKKRFDYNKMLQELIDSDERMKEVMRILKKICVKENFPVLILAKQVKIVNYIADNLSYLRVSRSTKEWKDFKESEILVGTYSKIGVGFDSNHFKTLVLLDNLKEIIQAEGRIRRDTFTIFDFVDNHFLFLKHWNERKNWFEKRGGIPSVELSLER